MSRVWICIWHWVASKKHVDEREGEVGTVEIKMDTLDIQTNIIIPGIKLKLLSTEIMNLELIYFSKYLMNKTTSIYL